MSSGDSEAPPTYYFSGMTFNPDFYTSSSSTYITKITGKKYFLSYPKAQGDETIDQIYAQNISAITPTETFNFLDTQTANIYIGENTTGTSGQIIQIGAPALTQTKIGALSIQETEINNSVDAAAGNIQIGNNQTTGTLYIGSGSGITRSGPINIGSYTNNTSTVNIGPASGSSTTNIYGKGVIYGTKFDVHNNATDVTLFNTTFNGTVTIADSQFSGILNIGNGTARGSLGAINIGSGTTKAVPITIGSSASNTTLNGTSVTIPTKLITPRIDGYSATTDLSIGSNMLQGNITIGSALTAGDITIGSSTQSGNILIGKSGATNSVYLGASGTTTVIDGNTLTLGTTSVPITMNASTSTLFTSGTISCRSGGMATFTSWNSADVNIGTESFSDLYLGYYASANGKTTRIRTENVIIGGGSTGTTTVNNTLSAGVGTLSGATAYETKAVSYTIPSTINRDYYLVVTLAAVTITLPAVKLNQIIHIRNASGGSITLTAPTGSIFPTVSSGGSFNTWTAFAVNTAQHLYCNGTNWYGF